MAGNIWRELPTTTYTPSISYQRRLNGFDSRRLHQLMREMSSFNRLFPPPPDYCHGWKSTFLHPTIGSLYPMLRTRVLLRRRQVLMVCQSLNRYSWRASHREVRTERVPQDVDARLRCPICLDGLSANRR